MKYLIIFALLITGCTTVQHEPTTDWWKWFEDRKLDANDWSETVHPNKVHCFKYSDPMRSVVYCDNANVGNQQLNLRSN